MPAMPEDWPAPQGNDDIDRSSEHQPDISAVLAPALIGVFLLFSLSPSNQNNPQPFKGVPTCVTFTPCCASAISIAR
jgi:hypothetical protein